jgi:ribosomal protein S18 acetylase RimI-like enzyme
LHLKPASQFSFAQLTQFWNLGYSGYFYPITFDEAAFQRWSTAGAFDLDHSLVMLDGDAPVGFSFLGVRQNRGWIGGFGIAPAYRGRGLASSLFASHVATFSALGLHSVQLEVLTRNWAQKVYARSGFHTTRRLAIMALTLPGDAGTGAADAATAAAGSAIATGDTATATGDTATAPGAVHTAHPQDLLAHLDTVHGDYPACWQRQPAYLRVTLSPAAQALYTGPADAPTGILLYATRENQVGIADFAARDAATATSLLQELARRHPGATLRIVNEPEGSPVHTALVAMGAQETDAQFEMHWRP